MGSMVVVTSFNEAIYAEYGRKMVESFEKHWPREVQMIATCQGKIEPIESDRIEWIDLDRASADLATFKRKFGRFMEAAGNVMRNGSEPGTMGLSYNYRYDALKFCHKVFSLFLVDAAVSFDHMVWLDADALTQHAVTPEWLFKVMPGDTEYQTYLGRTDETSEAGWIAFQRTHPAHGEFMQELRRIWLNGDIFALPEWHDSFVFDWIRHRFQAMGVMFRSLSGRGALTDHPFAHSPLAACIDHLKGPARKMAGTSRGTEFRNPSIEDVTAPKGGRYVMLAHLIADLKPRTIVEVGTWNGERAMIMAGVALAHGPVHYIGYDLFEDATPETDATEKNVKPHFTLEAVNKRLTTFQAKTKGFTFELVKGNTNETLPRWPSEADFIQPVFVFIDGGHSTQTIARDYAELAGADMVVLDDYYEGPIDTKRFGCNYVIHGLEPETWVLMPDKDRVEGGGKVRLAVVSDPATITEITEKYGCQEIALNEQENRDPPRPEGIETGREAVADRGNGAARTAAVGARTRKSRVKLAAGKQAPV